jgi:hypothetical protein
VLFIVAAGTFRAATFDLWGSPRSTPLKNGRWVGACLASLSIATSGFRLHLGVSEYLYVTALSVVGFLIIGFCGGYAWRLLSPLQE